MNNRRDFLQKLMGVTIGATSLDFLTSNLLLPSNIALADTSKTVNILNFFSNLSYELLAPMANGIDQGVGDLFQDYINSLNPYKA